MISRISRVSALLGVTAIFVGPALAADDTAAIERDSNVDNWRPETPMHLFHSRDDQTVPYAVSTATLARMRSLGATTVSLTDCSLSPGGHKECVPQYFDFSLGIARQAMGGW